MRRSGTKTLLGSIFGMKESAKDSEAAEEEGAWIPTVRRVVLESGYTFTQKGSSFRSHAYPEALLRVGMFADWFEFRIGQNFVSQDQTVAGIHASENGAQDLYPRRETGADRAKAVSARDRADSPDDRSDR